jgi:hypothetical protein
MTLGRAEITGDIAALLGAAVDGKGADLLVGRYEMFVQIIAN